MTYGPQCSAYQAKPRPGSSTRSARSGAFVGLANLSRAPQTVDADTVTGFGTYAPVLTSDGPPELRADRVLLPGLGFAWYAEH